jgi:hypothetical protein
MAHGSVTTRQWYRQHFGVDFEVQTLRELSSTERSLIREQQNGRFRMKAFALVVGLVIAAASLVPSAANAAGCLKGAVIGGVAGHFAGHGLLGAGAGCVIGHHYTHTHEHERTMHDRYDYR